MLQMEEAFSSLPTEKAFTVSHYWNRKNMKCRGYLNQICLYNKKIVNLLVEIVRG